MARTGKSARDIFAATTPAKTGGGKTAITKRPVGRPPLEERRTKVTVALPDQLIAWTDSTGAEIRAASGAVLNRSDLIGGILGAVKNAGVDLTSARTPVDVTRILAARLKR